MYSAQQCFTPFSTSVEGITLPERFTFPFYYEPHELCVLAANELQMHLEHQGEWQHNFGLTGQREGAIGKMFGVLVVQNREGELGYLKAFSGKLAEQNLLPGFVPPVFDMLTQDSFFHGEQQAINRLTDKLEALQNAPALVTLEAELKGLNGAKEQAVAALRAEIIENRKSRKARRQAGQGLDAQAFEVLQQQLGRESVAEKHRLRQLNLEWDDQIAARETRLSELRDEIEALKQQRASQSSALQRRLFAQYQFLNQAGEIKDLNSLFSASPKGFPPAGAGECAAPKLLQFAFENGLKPIAMAEFWWGASPKSEVKQHKQFYGACHGKCEPILAHMLSGMALDDNPLLNNPAEGKALSIIYQDEAIAVVNKPAEFLSVPGKHVTDSVYSRMRQAFPKATGPLIVHRLDMSTSGLMVIALSSEANTALVQQFIGRTVEKRYLAKVVGEVQGDEGEIKLPLRVDLDDRPRQLVCFEHGKHAHTYWEVKSRDEGSTLLSLFPKTGRTHQLRVHCAHQDGLGMPIIGDDLYGAKANRLHLHAQYLAFNHPISGERVSFSCDPDF
ncbi:RluA family pseudouridine synthase [Shewanella aquimarina]|uniref:RluA family pseudouridine synthase n=1 Tax=Shewanella aquimarina TaxID=260365 RepID=UPI00201490F4|nr:pseudouridine synthase [Shewanella aquimarina]MCL2908590.1 pseudouridine synthase [Shewanella aquimarina]